VEIAGEVTELAFLKTGSDVGEKEEQHAEDEREGSTAWRAGWGDGTAPTGCRSADEQLGVEEEF
jgi:hypothetical protein